MYLPLKLCAFAYKMFEHSLGIEQYYPPGCNATPAYRLFAQFHAPQTTEMKEEILKQLCSHASIVRVVFAPVAIGIGVDIPDIQHVIHVGPPCSVKAYFQETGPAGRDSKPSSTCLYYNDCDIGKNRVNMQNMWKFCASENVCLRKLLLNSLDFDDSFCKKKTLHLCCSICKKQCKHPECSLTLLLTYSYEKTHVINLHVNR